MIINFYRVPRVFLSISIVFLFVSITFPLTVNAVAPTSGLVGYWNMDEGSGTTAGDSSGNGNNGTLNPPAGGRPGVDYRESRERSGGVWMVPMASDFDIKMENYNSNKYATMYV